MSAPVAWRVVREGRWRWEAWALFEDDLWFWIDVAYTRRGARSIARRFVRGVRAQA